MNRRQVFQSIAVARLAMVRAFGADGARVFTASLGFAGRIGPVFQNGFFIFKEMDLVTVHVLNATGSLLMTRKIVVPDVAVTAVSAVAVSPSKTVVMAASAKDADGRFASLLILSDLNGSSTRVVRTNPYAANHVVFTPGGSLLCYGREYDENFNSVPGHSAIRFYSPDGILQRKAMNVDLLNIGPKEWPTHLWQGVLGADRIGLFDREQSLRYMEFDYNGALLRAPSALGVKSRNEVNGITLLTNGDRLISFPKSLTLQLLKDSADGVARAAVSGTQFPQDITAIRVVGTWNGDVVLLGGPGDRLVYMPQP